MITLYELNDYLHKTLSDPNLDVSKIDPFMANGMMVKGKNEVNKIGFGVSASLELFKKAAEENCDAIITHHSFNIPSTNGYDPIFQNRIQFLIENKMSLFGFHFLLDYHPKFGNNVQILKKIGANVKEPYYFHSNPWGWTGEMKSSKSMADIETEMSPYLSPRSLFYAFGPEKVKRIVAVSGKGAPSASEMKSLIDREIDLYITGEAHEWNRELFREAGINFIAGGHYHTEVFGLQALLEEMKKKIKTDFCWLKLTNDV